MVAVAAADSLSPQTRQRSARYPAANDEDGALSSASICPAAHPSAVAAAASAAAPDAAARDAATPKTAVAAATYAAERPDDSRSHPDPDCYRLEPRSAPTWFRWQSEDDSSGFRWWAAVAAGSTAAAGPLA